MKSINDATWKDAALIELNSTYDHMEGIMCATPKDLDKLNGCRRGVKRAIGLVEKIQEKP
jgi:hypothetical protein